MRRPTTAIQRKWRRVDEPGLEVLEVTPDEGGFCASSTIVHAGAEPHGVSYVWLLDRNWRTRRLDLRLAVPTLRELSIERVSDGWLIDGRRDARLAACDEIDLSATPFCNSLAINQLGGPGELTTLYVSVPSLVLSPSRQRYESLGGARWRYIDLGVARGFQADLKIDEDGLVVSYEGLFEAID
jgi:uncharacterized protein